MKGGLFVAAGNDVMFELPTQRSAKKDSASDDDTDRMSRKGKASEKGNKKVCAHLAQLLLLLLPLR